MDEIFPDDFLYPEELREKRKNKIFAESLGIEDSMKLALAILEKYPKTKVIYGIK